MKLKVKELVKGRTRIVFAQKGISIFWSNLEITKNIGLNVAINTAGLWTDSSKADWKVIEKKGDNVVLKIVFKELPLSQIWSLKFPAEKEIYWQIDTQIEEWIFIDEVRILCLLQPYYKNWICEYVEGNFVKLGKDWCNLHITSLPSSLVGVRFCAQEKLLPSFTMESLNKKFLPFVQVSPQIIGAYVVGFRSKDIKEFLPAYYHTFSGKLSLFEEEEILDERLEIPRSLKMKKDLRRKGFKKEKLKVLLLNLPWQKEGKWGVRAGSRWPHIKDDSEGNYLPFPFFLAYATSLLKNHNIDAHIIDAIAEKVSFEKLLKRIIREEYNIFVIETSVPSFYDDLEMTKKLSSLGKIILCGPNPLIYSKEFLKNIPFVDYVIYGEYEFALLNLIKALKEKKDLKNIKGVIFREGSDIIKTPPQELIDINLLPWPEREELPIYNYWDMPGNIPYPSVQMLSSRGCVFSCNFCLWPQVVFMKKYRARNIKDVVDEIQYMVEKFGFKSIYFDDDTFNIGKERILNLCKEIIKRDLNKIPWAIMAKADLMDEELLDNLKKAGLFSVKYGIENADQEIVNRCGKNLNLKKAEKMIKHTKSLGIKIHLTFSFGLEGETKDTIKKTIDYALKLNPDSVQFSIITPFPGTKLYDDLDKEGRILTKNWSFYDGHYSCVFRPQNLSPKDLEEAKQYAYRVWKDFQRKKRGFFGDLKRFLNYTKEKGLSYAFCKSFEYLKYLLFYRKKFLGKI